VEPGPERDILQLPWRKAIWRSAASNVNMVVAGSAVLGAALLHSLPVLAIGGVTYLALIAWDLVSREHWRRTIKGETDEPEKLPSPSSLRDPACKKALEQLSAAKKELNQVLARNTEQVNRYLSMTLGSLSELEDRAARLINRGEDLARYLSSVNPQTVGAEIRHLEQQMSQTTDADARAQFQSAREAREQQLQTLQELVSARDRVYAHLSHIVATYEGLPSRVVHMRALDAQAADVVSGDVNQELDRINREIGAFEETLKDVRVEARA
jgi:hypothetical protein